MKLGKDITHEVYQGKCEEYRDLELKCDVNIKHGMYLRCLNYAIEEAKCSGPVTHLNGNIIIGTCSWLGSPNIHRKDINERKSEGRCKSCSDRKIPCDGRPKSPRCSDCKKYEILTRWESPDLRHEFDGNMGCL